MDQVKTGRLIAALRKQAGLTQEALGERLGVTNKTLSRWERGHYMPDIEMLSLLSKELQVSMEELPAGEQLSGGQSPPKETGVTTEEFSAFSFEKKKWWKRKWRKNHAFLLVTLSILVLAALILPLLFHKPWLAALSPLIALLAYGYQNNRMAAYVEEHIYGK